jgi:hypothetical protein
VHAELAEGRFRPPVTDDDPGEALGGVDRPELDRWREALAAHRAWAETRARAQDEAEGGLWEDCER